MASFRVPALLRRTGRFASVDVVRGFAILAMAFYHLCWDLSSYGIIATDVVNDPEWKVFARAIAGTFLLLVGFNLVLATRNGFDRTAFLRRLAILVAAAAAVSIGTYVFMPESFVYFGILHLIALGSVLALPFLWLPVWVGAIVSVACLAAPAFLTLDLFGAPALLWLGLSPTPPPTIDYVPVLPWFGILLAGVVAGRLTLARYGVAALSRWQPQSAFWWAIRLLGRWSLPIYLVHQLAFIGIIYAMTAFVGVSEDAAADRFANQCAISQRSSGAGEDEAIAFCTCLRDGMRADNLMVKMLSGAMTPDEAARADQIAGRCAVPPPPSAGG